MHDRSRKRPRQLSDVELADLSEEEYRRYDAEMAASLREQARRKRPRDLNQLAKSIVDEATDVDKRYTERTDTRDPLAVELGRRGGLKGGRARAEKLTPEQRSEIARRAAAARWGKSG